MTPAAEGPARRAATGLARVRGGRRRSVISFRHRSCLLSSVQAFYAAGQGGGRLRAELLRRRHDDPVHGVRVAAVRTPFRRLRPDAEGLAVAPEHGVVLDDRAHPGRGGGGRNLQRHPHRPNARTRPDEGGGGGRGVCRRRCRPCSVLSAACRLVECIGLAVGAASFRGAVVAAAGRGGLRWPAASSRAVPGALVIFRRRVRRGDFLSWLHPIAR